MLRKLRLLDLPVMVWFPSSGCWFTASGRWGSGVYNLGISCSCF